MMTPDKDAQEVIWSCAIATLLLILWYILSWYEERRKEIEKGER